MASSMVDGRGLWNSWCRNFSKPITALFDLLDNAVDAAGEVGTIALQQDGNKPGITMFNSCSRPPKSMAKIMVAYNSSKLEDEIGQNGVGLKQGCACLSPLSICITKSHDEYSLGFIAEMLQSDKEIVLPFLVLKGSTGDELIAELHATAVSDRNLFRCLERYGERSFERGVIDFVKHMMALRDFGDSQFGFALIIHELKHGKKQDEGSARYLLDEVHKELPYRYLHIPPQVVVTMRGERVDFNYWQSQLAEFTEMKLRVNRNVLVENDPDWNSPSNHEDDYGTIRLFMGFDVKRVVSKESNKALTLYVYSRRCGRLIFKDEDARRRLNLSQGSTEYCQGLTALLDDKDSHLPLNPTKQDLAFSELENGEIFKANLEKWMFTSIKSYYKFFKEGSCHDSKKLLTKAVEQLEPTIQSTILAGGKPNLRNCELSTFANFAHRMHGKTIAIQPRDKVKFTQGRHTTSFKTLPPEEFEASATLPRAKRKRKSAPPVLRPGEPIRVQSCVSRSPELAVSTPQCQLGPATSTAQLEHRIGVLDRKLQNKKIRKQRDAALIEDLKRSGHEKDKLLAEKDQQIHHLERSRDEKDRLLEGKDKQIQHSERSDHEKNKLLEEKDKRIQQFERSDHEKGRLLEEKDKRIQYFERSDHEKDKLLAEKETRIQLLERTLHENEKGKPIQHSERSDHKEDKLLEEKDKRIQHFVRSDHGMTGNGNSVWAK